MVVALRLQRVGKRNQALYRVVAIDSRKRVRGEPLEILGHFDPVHKKVELKIDNYEKWLKNGAQPSDTVKALYKKLTKKKKIESEIIDAITHH